MKTTAAINLKSIRKYNPGTLDDEDVINNYISRKAIFQKLIKEIESETNDSIPQHHLIIGQRGMGKTTLLKRIEVEIKTKEDLNQHFVPVLYPEEQYNIDRLSKFWFNTLDQLLDYIDTQISSEEANTIDNQVQQIINAYEEEVLADKAYKLVLQAIGKINKRPVLLIDNIDQLFSLLKENELWQIRQKITDNGAPIFIGASSAPFDEVFTYDKAFYDHFKTKYLDPLTETQFTDLIQTLASNLNDEQLKLAFRQKQSRIQSLYRLAGGNIRTAIILFSSLTNGFGDSISDDLDELLDEMTPIYKARIEELSDQLKAIIDEIALEHKPIDLERLRDRTRISNNTLSPQIKRLRQMGWISVESNIKSRSNYYQITERFFNVWYLMRRSTRRNKRNISVLSAFLKEWIENKDSQGELLLAQSITKSSDIMTRLALSDHITDANIKSALISQAQDGIEQLSAGNSIVAEQFSAYRRKGSNVELPYWIKDFRTKYKSGDYESVEKFLQDIVKNNTENQNAWFGLGVLYQRDLNEYQKSKDCYKRVLELDEKNIYALHNLGNLYKNHLQEYQKSKDCFEKVLELDDNFVHSWSELGNLNISHFHDYQKSKECYEKALSIDNQYIYALNGLGNLYQDHLNDQDRAIEYYNKILEIDEHEKVAKYNLVFLLRDIKGDKNKAREIFLSLENSEESAIVDTYYLHHSLFEVYDQNYGLAKDYLKKAIEYLSNKPPSYTIDDWVRYAAVAIHKGFGKYLIETLSASGIHNIMRPYYDACIALHDGGEEYLYRQSVEVRETAFEVLQHMQKYKSMLPD